MCDPKKENHYGLKSKYLAVCAVQIYYNDLPIMCGIIDVKVNLLVWDKLPPHQFAQVFQEEAAAKQKNPHILLFDEVMGCSNNPSDRVANSYGKKTICPSADGFFGQILKRRVGLMTALHCSMTTMHVCAPRIL